MPDQNIDLSTLIKKFITAEYITVVTFLIYGWGFLYNYLYYHSFGINIIKYISLQETLIETILYIIIFGFVSTVIVAVLYYISYRVFLFNKKNRFPKYVALIRKRPTRYFLDFLSLRFYFTYGFILLILIVLILFKLETYTFFKLVPPIIGTSSVLIMYYYKSYLRNKTIEKIFYSFIVVVIISSIYIISLKQIEQILVSKSINKEIISLNTGITYTTNDSIFYIGETSSTIFLFNKPLNNTIIINKSNVVQTQLINQATIKIKNEAIK